jgi:hypothetical protein
MSGNVTVKIPADETAVHPALWGAAGVADAARDVATASKAPLELAEQRRREHAEWRRRNYEAARERDFEPTPEPPAEIQHNERLALQEAKRTAEIRLEALVGASAELVRDELRDWESAALAEAAGHVAALDRLCADAARAGRALTAVSSALHRAPDRQSTPHLEDLVYLVRKGEGAALLNFGDGRVLWLQATRRS